MTRETPEQRLRGMIDSLRRYGRLQRAAHYEYKLARIENRAAEEWATAALPEPEEAPARLKDGLPVLPSLSPSIQARLNRSLAREWRKAGNTARAEALEAEAERLAPAPLGDF